MLLLIGVGCGEDPAPRCVAGKVEACPCPGGAQGSQTCSDQGAFGACECPTVDAGPDDLGRADDASGTFDAGQPDGGGSPPDALVDAGPPDAADAEPDASQAPTDAAPRDAAPDAAVGPDATQGPDAASPDAEPTDASGPADALSADAPSLDAALLDATPADLGSADPDAGAGDGAPDAGPVDAARPVSDCALDGDCGAGDVCAFVDLGGGDYVRRCGPPTGPGGILDPCTTPADCAHGLCLPARFGAVCAVPCTVVTNCGIGASCQTVALGGGTVDVCAPAPSTGCTSDDDCGPGTRCQVVPNAAGSALETVCAPERVASGNGAPCGDHVDCRHGACVGGFCAAPCASGGDCLASQTCEPTALTVAGVPGALSLCRAYQDTVCTSNRDCGSRSCSDLRVGPSGVVEAICAAPRPSGAAVGGACVVDTDCASGLCQDWSGECTVVCTDAGLDCPAGFGCSQFVYDPGNVGVGLCVRGCADDGDCAGGDVCGLFANIPANQVDLLCREAQGVAGLGEPCASGADCRTGLCNTFQSTNGQPCASPATCGGLDCVCPLGQPSCVSGKQCGTRIQACTSICDSNGDCAGGPQNPFTVCAADTEVSLPSGGGTVTISTCSPP